MEFIAGCKQALQKHHNQAWLWVFFVLLMLISAPVFAKNSTPKQLDENNSTEILDYEILLLRAEIAHKTTRIEAFNSYMNRLEKFVPPEQFATRFEVLQILWQQMAGFAPENPNANPVENAGEGSVETSAAASFASAKTAKTIVIMLPLTGDYATAGQVIVEKLELAFASEKTYIIDSSLYDDMDELWSLAKMFSPDLVIGPLSKPKAQAIANRNQSIPMLTFTSIEKNALEKPHILSLASMNQSYALAFRELFETIEPHNQAWLQDGSRSAKELVKLINQPSAKGEKETATELVSAEVIQYGVDRSLAKLMGSEASLGRKNWLAKTIGSSVEFDVRPRRDKKVIVALMSQRQAVQVAPMVNYYQLKMPVIWVPTDLPSLEKFQQNLPNWQATYSLLPANLTYQFTDATNVNSTEQKVGLFHALAELAVDLVKYADNEKPFRFKHDIGWVFVDLDGTYYLEASIYRMHKGSLKAIASGDLR